MSDSDCHGERRAPRAAVADPSSAFLTVQQFSNHFGWSPRRTWALIAAGEIRAIHFGARTTRIERSEVERLLSAAKSRAS